MKRNYSKDVIKLLTDATPDDIDSRIVGKIIVELYMADMKNKKMRYLFCKTVSKMKPDDVKFTLIWLKHRCFNMRVEFLPEDAKVIGQSILRKIFYREEEAKIREYKDAIIYALFDDSTYLHLFIKESTSRYPTYS
ncbi:hypothetical protein [Trabulsiella odontotermitis]|uniref:hypothetical protein n=1 Tax=Trabulsiella odontotermitis TaxID=379893 RepID=UPI0006BA1F42|nr:hypothetical protein [Trabulsiella odontotermitis]